MSEHGEAVALERRGAAAWIWLQRPEVHNAFDDAVIARLTGLVEAASGDPEVRVIVLAGRGKSFSAGADLDWMRRAAACSEEENLADALRLAAMLRAIAHSPKATCARVHGAALGGGLGLVAACDVAFATVGARFGLSEVKLGLVPGVISPYVIEKIGPGRARELFVTGERFDAARAERLGLLASVVPDEAALDAAVDGFVAQVRTSGPEAVAAARELIRGVCALPPGPERERYTAGAIAARRASPEGREGVSAFLARRKPDWCPG